MCATILLLENVKYYLHNCVSIVYITRMTKDSGFRIRVERELREKFLEICREQDRPAAQILREYMREYVAANDLQKTKNKDKA